MSETTEDLNWRVFNHLLATHGSFPQNSITTNFVSGALDISYNEANAALWWAVDQDFMVPVHNEHKPENLYQFADLEIKNGMIIEPDPEMMDLIESGRIPGSLLLESPGFEVKLSQGVGGSCVLKDNRVMIKGLGYFPQKLFRKKVANEKQLYLVRDENLQFAPAYWKEGVWSRPDGRVLKVSFVVGKVVPCLNPDPN